MKSICFFTGTRAEYYLLRPLMREVAKAGDLKLQLLVSGSHLSVEHGYTAEIIEKDGFYIDERVEILVNSDSRVGVCKSAGLGFVGFSEALARLSPDIIVVLGDRYEAFVAAGVATLMNLCLVHLHGGELTEGAVDDVFRHAITKMSHLHFVATDVYRQRVIQLGECPESVVVSGALGLVDLESIEQIPQEELEKELGFSFSHPSTIVTFHPVTRKGDDGRQQMQALLDALAQMKELNILFTGINADSGGRSLSEQVQRFAEEHGGQVKIVNNLGQRRYFNAMKYAGCIIGNSSSAIIEAPSFGVPVINIGDRQKGRVQAENTINVQPEAKAIYNACLLAFSDAFKSKACKVKNPYYKEGTLRIILDRMRTVDPLATQKSFYDLDSRMG